MKSHAIIYPGTFDPITLGHLDIITRAAQIFEKVIVAVSVDTAKKTLFSPEDRLELVRLTLSSLPFSNIKLLSFKGLLINFAREQNISLLLRGIRTFGDFEYEQQLAQMNQHLDNNLDTLFIPASEKYNFISGTFVRDIIRLRGNLTGLVPEMIIPKLAAHSGEKD